MSEERYHPNAIREAEPTKTRRVRTLFLRNRQQARDFYLASRQCVLEGRPPPIISLPDGLEREARWWCTGVRTVRGGAELRLHEAVEVVQVVNLKDAREAG